MTIKRPQAILFDWDGTLVETWGVVHAALNDTLVAMGHPPWSVEEAHERIGPPARVLFSGLFGADRWQTADKIYLAAYESHIAGHLRLHAGAEDLLMFVQARGLYIAAVSAKRGNMLRREAAVLGIEHFFTRMVGAGDAAADKPDPAAVALALEGSGISPGRDVWFYGDSVTDILAARHAGCVAALVEIAPVPAALIAQNPPDLHVRSHAAFIQKIEQAKN